MILCDDFFGGGFYLRQTFERETANAGRCSSLLCTCRFRYCIFALNCSCIISQYWCLSFPEHNTGYKPPTFSPFLDPFVIIRDLVLWKGSEMSWLTTELCQNKKTALVCVIRFRFYLFIYLFIWELSFVSERWKKYNILEKDAGKHAESISGHRCNIQLWKKWAYN